MKIDKNFDFNRIVEGSTSRIYHHIKNDESWAIISAYRWENDESTNRALLQNLKDDARYKYNCGFMEFVSKWTGDGMTSNERAILIPNISEKAAIRLGQKYSQSSIIYCSNSVCREICTTDFTDKDGNLITVGTVIRTFDIDSNTPMNLELADKIFRGKEDGAYSLKVKGSNAKPFTLQEVYEVNPPKPSSFRGASEFRIF